MPNRTSLNVSLTPELERFVEQRVSSGRYQTASEVIREGLRLLEQQEQQRQARLAAIKAKLEKGVQQADHGEVVDPDSVLREIEQRKRRWAAGKR